MDNIKDIVKGVIGQMALKQPTPSEKIERILKNILDQQELKHIKFVGEKEGQLSISVDSPAWLYQMNTKKNRILDQLKDEITDVKGIRFRIGKVT